MMEIVKMDETHISQIAALEKRCFSDPWSENSIAGELSSRLSYWLVAVENGEVVGYIGSQSVLGQSDMMNVAVHPDYRRKGIAEALILALSADLKERQNQCLTLEVRASNAPAITLYEKLGFDTVGRRPNYYRHPKEDALIMRKEWQI
jgi:ribosomal-protein-alanine N-acetyltransferase